MKKTAKKFVCRDAQELRTTIHLARSLGFRLYKTQKDDKGQIHALFLGSVH